MRFGARRVISISLKAGISCSILSSVSKNQTILKSFTARNMSVSSSPELNHPFFRHNDKQTVVPVQGKVLNGTIPKWLQGTLIRNGPGIQKVGNTEYHHLFDGLAILHKFDIKDGKAFYQSRALESEAYKQNLAADRIVVNEFGTAAYPDPCQSIFGRLQSKFWNFVGSNAPPDHLEMTDNCVVNVGFYGDQLYAMTETVFVRRVDPETLKTIGDKTKISDYCVLNTATAHPHCLEDGTIINVGNNFRNKRGSQYCFARIPPSDNEETAFKNAKIIAQFPSRWKLNPCYFHSFGMTKDKLIFVEAPLCLDLLAISASTLTSASYEGCLKWHGKEKTKFHVLSMEDGKVHPITYETDNLFLFHHINAYEENGCLVVDVAGYNDAGFVKNARVEQTLKNELDTVEGATARRYVLPLKVDGAKPGDNLVNLPNTEAKAILRNINGDTPTIDLIPHHFTKDWLELPRMNYKFNGQKYKFFYGLRGNSSKNIVVPSPNMISKIDTETGAVLDYIIDGVMATEPIFVQDPTLGSNNTTEDDGVILAAILMPEPSEVCLVVLNAKDMKEQAKIMFKAEGAVTATFHGIWQGLEK